MPFTAPVLWQEITQEVIDESGDPTRLQPALGDYQTTMQDVVSPLLPDGTTANPYEDVVYRGDPNYLEDKFVRFSYRFKFDDGEYSVFAPFTQECFIPQQDGYFLFNPSGTDRNDNDMSAAYRSTIVEFMENKVNQLTLLIEMPVVGDPALGTTNLFNVSSYFKITEIEILFKESDGAAVLVVDTIPADDIKDQFSSSNPTNNVYQYRYSGTKPFRTLPESQLTRVYDKVPVKALSQEVISNRVVYGNFQTRHTPPNGLNYNVGTGPKQPFDITTPVTPVSWNTSIIEYPSSTLKQNRNYQAGFVFSDKFGRTTSTILSNTGDVASSATASSLSTVYSPYNDNLVDIGLWPGDTLLIQVNDTISETPVASTLYPGTYNGDPADLLYNPLGFKSWKVVVKQQEQDYYNVYLPGSITAYPEDDELEFGLTSHIVLLNDNINKVPRDLSQVGPDQKQFRSSVQLFGRVENTDQSPTPNAAAGGIPTNYGVVNQQYYPSRFSDTVSTISNEFDMFNLDPGTPLDPEYEEAFYEAASNPLIGRVSTTDQFGQIDPTSGSLTYTIQNLAVYETEPVESRLDIYWETSSSGTIDDLNEQVIATGGQTIFGIINDSWFLNEYFNKQTASSSPWSETTLNPSPEPGPAPASPVIGPLNAEYGRYRSVVMGPFWFDDNTNTPIQNVELDSFSVEDGNNAMVTSDFDILRIKGTGSTPAGIGNYIDFTGATTTTYTHDTFILVNKAFHLYDSADIPATQFTLKVSVKDLDNPNPPPIPIKTFTLTSILDGTNLDDVPTVQVGGETLITTPGYVNTSWGQTTNTPIDYGQEDAFGPTPAGGPPGQIVIQVGYAGIPLKLYGSNGSNVALLSPSQNQNSLFWDIPVQTKGGLPSTAFQIDSSTGEVTETSFGVARGQHDLKIRVSAYGTFQTINISIVIGVPTANGSFNNNIIDEDLFTDRGYIFNLHDSISNAYDQIPSSAGGVANTSFKYTYPDPGFIPGTATLNDSFSTTCGSYSYGSGINILTLQQPSGSGALEGPLTQGTGYIKFEIDLDGFRTIDFNQWTSCSFSWAVEYRPTSASDWQAATDIEGNILSWNNDLTGSIQTNPQQSGQRLDGLTLTSGALSWSQPQSTSTYINDQIYGAPSAGGVPSGTPFIPSANPNSYKAVSRNRSSGSTQPSNTKLAKWVAVGNSPTYSTTPCFGEYRIIIQTIGGQTSANDAACVGCFKDASDPNQTGTSLSFQPANISIGDFFYDLGPQRAFAYLVDTKTFPTTTSGKNDALNNTFGTIGTRYKILYALEPVHRYVSTFYSDAALTVPFIAWDLSVGGNPGYISYRSVDGVTGVPGSTPPLNAGVTSKTNIPNAHSAEGAGSPSATPNTLQDKRVWACLMEASTGTKVMGTSIGRVG